MPTKKKLRPTQLAARRRAIMDEIAALNKEKAALDEELLTLDPDTDLTNDGVHLSFTPFREIDKSFVTKKFPADKYPQYYKLELDTTEFKKHFSQKQLETFQKVTHRISVKALED